MLTQINLSTLKCLERAEYLSRSIRIHLSLVSTLLAEFFSTLPARGEDKAPWPDWTAVQEANLGKLEQVASVANQASQAHSEAKVQVGQTTKNRNNVVDRLTRFYRRLRASIGAIYGPEVLSELGLADVPARGYLAVREQCRMVAKRLRLPDLLARLGEPLAGYSHPDFAKISKALLADLGLYEQVVSDLTDARKLRDEAMVEKEAAVRELKAVLANVGRVQESYARMAGLGELADRIRLTIPKSSKSTESSKSSTLAELMELMEPMESTVEEEATT